MPVPTPDLSALRVLGDRVRPLAGAEERLLPVPEPLRPLLPSGGLRRGSTAATTGHGAASLALALAGPSTGTGGWIAAVGLPALGWLAAAELGVDLGRVVLVAEPPADQWPTAVAALLDAVDLVLVRPPRAQSPSLARRLLSRARERGSVLLQVGGDPTHLGGAPDLLVRGVASSWVGIGRGHGQGHLRGRKVEVEVSGRRSADRARRASLWLPVPQGGLAPVDPVPARRADPLGPTHDAPEIALREVG